MRKEELSKYLATIGRAGGLKMTPKKKLACLSAIEKINLKKN
jgi:hypothetical protein